MIVDAGNRDANIGVFSHESVDDQPRVDFLILLDRKECVDDFYILEVNTFKETLADLMRKLLMLRVRQCHPLREINLPEFFLGHTISQITNKLRGTEESSDFLSAQ